MNEASFALFSMGAHLTGIIRFAWVTSIFSIRYLHCCAYISSAKVVRTVTLAPFFPNLLHAGLWEKYIGRAKELTFLGYDKGPVVVLNGIL